ncbi:MAG: aminodeoxychorismate synthase component I [Vicinamibacteraceae bacterium]
MSCITSAVFESFNTTRPAWGPLVFEHPVEVHVATRLDQVLPVLAEADRAARRGLWAVIALAYEAAPAFEPALAPTARSSDQPLACVSLFADAADRLPDVEVPRCPRRLTLQPAISREWFQTAVHKVQGHIRAGDTYQVNLTFPMKGAWAGSPYALYRELCESQQAGYSAYLVCGERAVLSLSPELFFEREGSVIRTRPMKGTCPRGRWLEEDRHLADRLAHCEKARAENVMIVDLLRNDLGRVAAVGSVQVRDLFTVEPYPTLWQMTSTIEARLREASERPSDGRPHVGDASLLDILRALFPCGSITGAPKIRTMEILRALEVAPRGLYTGTIGYVTPGGDCVFNVAIRTILIDQHTKSATLGVGAGITADSLANAEYDECVLKAAFTTARPWIRAAADGQPASRCASDETSFELFETLRLADGRLWLLQRHLERLEASARFLGFRWDAAIARDALDRVRRAHLEGTWRVKLLLARDGDVQTHCARLHDESPRIWRVAVAGRPIDAADLRLFHKTTHREIYDAAARSRPEADEVLLWNRSGDITESTIANIVVEKAGALLTPSRECGLLAGTFRAELLASGAIRESLLTRDDLRESPRMWLINAVRGWIPAEIVP